MTPKLKPCPFCGGEARIMPRFIYKKITNSEAPIEYHYRIYALCQNCHAMSYPIDAVVNQYTPHDTTDEAQSAYEPFMARVIEAWNRRVTDE